jgi:hypothetical protein
MAPHTTGSLAGGKSQFFYHLNEQRLVLDGAAYVDQAGLWAVSETAVLQLVQFSPENDVLQ